MQGFGRYECELLTLRELEAFGAPLRSVLAASGADSSTEAAAGEHGLSNAHLHILTLHTAAQIYSAYSSTNLLCIQQHQYTLPAAQPV